MSDELDRELLRQFAKANEPLQDTQFHANVMLEISRLSSPWRDLPQFIASSVEATGAGFMVGLRALARMRLGVVGIAALLGALAFLSA
jgi:hypothetical protein